LHNGCINVVLLRENQILTAGADGYIRWWNAEAINNAEPDDTIEFYITMENEQFIQAENVPCVINYMITYEEKSWIVQDTNGLIIKITENSPDITIIHRFHGGKINGLAINYRNNMIASCGDEGIVRLWNPITKS